jgi:hypothetical protein
MKDVNSTQEGAHFMTRRERFLGPIRAIAKPYCFRLERPKAHPFYPFWAPELAPHSARQDGPRGITAQYHAGLWPENPKKTGLNGTRQDCTSRLLSV